MNGNKVLVAVYDDGSRSTCDPEDWLKDNAGDQEVAAVYQELCAGRSVMMGGGAQPLCRIWLEEAGGGTPSKMSEHMQFIHDDGGRKDSGRRGSAGDCVCRAIAIASGIPYESIYRDLSNGAAMERQSRTGRSARNGVHTTRKWFKDYLRSLGFVWVPCMGIGTGCKVHLAAGELPMGRLIVAVSKHYVAVIDGVIHDTHDPQRGWAAFRQFPGWQTAELKPGEQRNLNGIFRTSERCVYGYWKLAVG